VVSEQLATVQKLFFIFFLIAEAIIECWDHLIGEQINGATSKSEKLSTMYKIFFLSQLTNIDYESPTINRSTYEFTNFLRDEKFS
jgi:hypothetical protein